MKNAVKEKAVKFGKLYLDRNINEGFRIGENIYITVENIWGNPKRVKIGIKAPKDIKILRNELSVYKEEVIET